MWGFFNTGNKLLLVVLQSFRKKNFNHDWWSFVVIRTWKTRTLSTGYYHAKLQGAWQNTQVRALKKIWPFVSLYTLTRMFLTFTFWNEFGNFRRCLVCYRQILHDPPANFHCFSSKFCISNHAKQMFYPVISFNLYWQIYSGGNHYMSENWENIDTRLFERFKM